LQAYPNFWHKGVPIAGGTSGIDAKKLRRISVWTFAGEGDTRVSWLPTKTIVEAMVRDNQDVKFTHEKKRNHEDAYVWTNYNTTEWLLSERDPSPLICTPECEGFRHCTLDGCNCYPTFFGSDCLSAYVGPETLGNDGSGSAHLVIQATSTWTGGYATNLEGYFNKGTPGGNPPKYEVRVYEKVGENSFKLIDKQSITVDLTSKDLQNVTINPPLRVPIDNYIGLINLEGSLGMANNQGGDVGYYYSNDPKNNIGDIEDTTLWKGNAPWRILFKSDGNFDPEEEMSVGALMSTSISLMLLIVVLLM